MEKPEYEKILKAKIEYYGETLAAYQFAGEEFERQITKWYVTDPTPSNGWVDVNDRVPEHRQVVIIHWHDWDNKGVMRVTSGSYNSTYNYWQHGNATELKVTHWQPLPSPPLAKKGGGNGE